MGFLEPDTLKPRKPVASRKLAAGFVRKARETGCDACILKSVWPRLATPQMPMSGNVVEGDILVLGLAPTEPDDREGEAFSGPGWRPLEKLIPNAFRDRLVFQNLARCSPMHATVTPDEVYACSVHLKQDVNTLPKLRAILGVGQGPLEFFFPGARIYDFHGLKMPVKLGEHTAWFYPVLGPEYLVPKERHDGKQQGPEDAPAYPVFKADLRRFFREVDEWKRPRIQEGIDPKRVVVPASLAEAHEVLARMDAKAVLGIDLESGNLQLRKAELRAYNTGAKILCAAVSDGDTTMAFPLGHPDDPNTWGLKLLHEVIHNRPWCAHNAALEYTWLAFECQQAGMVWDPVLPDDTMAIARLLNRRKGASGLDDIGMLVLGVNTKTLSNVRAEKIMDYPLSEILPYCGTDAQTSALVFKRAAHLVDAENYQRLLETTRTTSDMTLEGLDIDFDLVHQMLKEHEAERARLESLISQSFEVRQFERATGRKFNPGSNPDIAKVLVEYARLELPTTGKSDALATSEEALRAAVGDEGHPLVDALLDWREIDKRHGTYLLPLAEARERCYDSRLHPSYNALKLHTYRLSSEDPNIQNYPGRAGKELRRCVRAHIHKRLKTRLYFCKFDYKALEARIIAMASKDRAFMKSILEGEDIHGRWLRRVLEIYPEYIDRLAEKLKTDDEKELMKGGRNIIKTDFVFASFYGASIGSCSIRTGMPMETAIELSEEFWGVYKGAKQWVRNARDRYRDTGSCFSLLGHERHGIMTGNEPINNPIQGTGAHIVADSMNELAAMSRKLKDPFLHPRIQIHDDLTFLLPQDERLEGYIDTITQTLVKVRYDWQIVPLAVEGSLGDNWGDMHEFCNVEGDYVR